jgi:hypothetical protein
LHNSACKNVAAHIQSTVADLRYIRQNVCNTQDARNNNIDAHVLYGSRAVQFCTQLVSQLLFLVKLIDGQAAVLAHEAYVAHTLCFAVGVTRGALTLFDGSTRLVEPPARSSVPYIRDKGTIVFALFVGGQARLCSSITCARCTAREITCKLCWITRSIGPKQRFFAAAVSIAVATAP